MVAVWLFIFQKHGPIFGGRFEGELLTIRLRSQRFKQNYSQTRYDSYYDTFG
jgi:hypothetical protein